jgi:ATP-dependent phosphofructokinase / diphosphate-dependent phosphofructokinase
MHWQPTGGSDVPGLNAVIKIVTYRGSEDDNRGYRSSHGWEALTHLNVEDSAGRLRS